MHLRHDLLHAFTPLFTPCIYTIFYAMHLRHTDGWEVIGTKENTVQAKTVDLTPDVSTPAVVTPDVSTPAVVTPEVSTPAVVAVVDAPALADDDAAKPKGDDNATLGIECNVFLKDLRQQLEKLPEVDRVRLARHLGKCLDSFLVGEGKAVDIESFDIPQKQLRLSQMEEKNPLVIKIWPRKKGLDRLGCYIPVCYQRPHDQRRYVYFKQEKPCTVENPNFIKYAQAYLDKIWKKHKSYDEAYNWIWDPSWMPRKEHPGLTEIREKYLTMFKRKQQAVYDNMKKKKDEENR